MRTFFFFLLILSAGCRHTDPDLENALRQAGENRSQLEQVLDHYRNDSLKYKAACFLIANMPGHYSYGGEVLDTYYFSVDSLFRIGAPCEQTNRQIDELAQNLQISRYAKIIEDVKTITAEYLIDNIDRAFDDWQNKEINEHVDFEHFCEYLLPYRISNEPLEYWRDMLSGKYREIEDMGYIYGDRPSAYWACSVVNDRLRETHRGSVFRLHHSFLPLNYSTLNIINYGTCKEYAHLATFAMRGKGIPVAIDFTPQWAHISSGHYWNSVYVKRGKNVIFEPLGSNPGERHRDEVVKAKVYRYRYAINKNALSRLNTAQEPVPSFFNTPFYQDVTAEYTATSDVEIEMLRSPSQKRDFAYLCVFDNQKWEPIHFAPLKRGKARFTDMGRDIVYLPGYYIEGEIEQSGYPFILDVFGEIHPLIPDTIHTHPLRLERKYPISNRLIDHSNKLLAGCIQASADSTFTDPVTFHIIARNTQGAPDTATIDSSRQPFRYWRYLSPNGSFCQIAELQFFKPDSLSPLPGRAIGTPGTLNNAFDGDPLTFYEYHEADGGWIGLDFGKPTRIDRIAFQPRNDDNYVVAGDEYELFYRSSTAWESLGKQKPSHPWVEYPAVPSNALLLLKNHSRGQEERIFTWEKQKQKWW